MNIIISLANKALTYYYVVKLKLMWAVIFTFLM